MLGASTIEERFMLMIGKTPIVTRRNIEMTIQDRIYDVSKAEKEIGFKPCISMEEGIKESIEWYKKEKLI